MAVDVQPSRRFWLVQRIRHSPYEQHEKAFPDAKVKSNPFGYGRLGDYELDYMGSAEFEFGTIPEANNRLAKAKKDLRLEEFEYGGHTFDFLWIGREGEPFEDWIGWVEGKPYRTDYGGPYDRRPLEGKESTWELRERLDGKEQPKWGWRADVWWGLNENVMWAFADDGERHLHKMLESMGSAPVEFLR